MVAKKNNNNKRTLLIIVGVLLLVVLLYSVYAMNKTDKRIDYTEFKSMVKTEQISEVYINDYTIYVKKKQVISHYFPYSHIIFILSLISTFIFTHITKILLLPIHINYSLLFFLFCATILV